MSGPGKPIAAHAGMDRRSLMRWASAVAASLASDGYFGRGQAFAAPVAGAGYGRDPNLVEPKTPWPRTMSASQLGATMLLCDFILPAEGPAPAASALGVHELLDEWVSAPYPSQQEDREQILPGLAWLETEALRQGAKSFATAPAPLRAAILTRLEQMALADADSSPQARFYRRVRRLVIGAYFTTEAGFKDIGYIGNQALAAYPAPSPEVMAVLDRESRKLGLPIEMPPGFGAASTP